MAAEILKRRKLKLTPARLAVLALFESSLCQPLSADDIHLKLKKLKKAEIDLVTVYRTLASFEKEGILKKVDLHKSAAYYELADGTADGGSKRKHHHHHIVCTACGLIEGFDDCNVEALSKKALAASSKFSSVSKHSLELFGVCKACSKR